MAGPLLEAAIRKEIGPAQPGDIPPDEAGPPPPPTLQGPSVEDIQVIRHPDDAQRSIDSSREQLRSYQSPTAPVDEFDQRQLYEDQLDVMAKSFLKLGQFRSGGDREAGVIGLHERTGLSFGAIESKYDEIEDAVKWSGYDHHLWRITNPGQFEWMLTTPEAVGAIRDEKISGYNLHQRQLRANERFASLTTGLPAFGGTLPSGTDVLAAVVDTAVTTPRSVGAGVLKSVGGVVGGLGGLIIQNMVDTFTDPLREQKLEAAKEDVRTAGEPRQVPVEESELQLGGEDSDIPGVLWDKVIRTRKGLEASYLGFNQLMLDVHLRRADKNEDLKEYEARRSAAQTNRQAIIEIEDSLAVQQDYGQGEIGQFILDAVEGLASQFETVGALAGGLVIGGGGGALVGTVTAGPVGTVVGFVTGTTLVTRVLMGGSTLLLETGGAYNEFIKMPGMDPDMAVGGALLSGVTSMLIEQGTFATKLKAFGPVGEALASGRASAWRKALNAGGTKLTLGSVGRAFGKSMRGAVAEGEEEWWQEGTKIGYGWLGQSLSMGKIADFDFIAFQEGTDLSRYMGFAGGLPLSMGGGGFSLMQSGLAHQSAVKGGAQVEALAELANSELSRRAPKLVAKLVEIESRNSQQPVDHLYVDPQKLAETVEAAGGNLEETLTTLMGKEGPAKFKEALQAVTDIPGGKATLPVAVEQYLEKWGGISETLAQDTTVRPGQETTRELKELPENFKKLVAELIKEVGEEGLDISPMEAQFVATLEDQLVQTRKMSPREAKASLAPTRAFVRTMLAKTPAAAEAVFREWTMAALSEETLVLVVPEAARVLAEKVEGMSTKQRAEVLFLDPNVGIFGERGFKTELKRKGTEGRFLVRYKFAGTKWKNNEGHTPGNELYRLVGGGLSEIVDDAAKWGGDFASTASSVQEGWDNGKQLKIKIAERLRAANPEIADQIQGLDVIASVVPIGDDIDEAWERAGTMGATEAKTREALDVGDPNRRAVRGEKPLGLPVDDPRDLSLPKDLPSMRAVPSDLLAEVEGMMPEDVFKAAYTDPTMGMITREGFLALPAKAHVFSLDLNGLGAFNDVKGFAFGNGILKAFAQAARLSGASQLDMAHFSGDEFAFQTDDLEKGQFFVDVLHELLESETATEGVEVQTEDGRWIKGITLGYAQGENYDAADAKVKAHKDRELKDPGIEARDRAQRTEDRLAGKGVVEREGPDQGDTDRGGPDLGEGREDLARGSGAQVHPRIRQRSLAGPRGRRAATRAIRLNEARRIIFRSADPREVARLLKDLTTPESIEAGKLAVADTQPQLADIEPDIWYDVYNVPYAGETLEQPGDGRVRGLIDIVRAGAQKAMRIFLGPDADLSTMLHEQSHAYLELFHDIATHPQADQTIKDDYAKALDWLGVESFDNLTKVQKEKWAKNWEAYFMEGKAPSVKLAGPFALFSTWLKSIYGTLQSIGAEVDPDIRPLFDRMLATDNELKRMQGAAALDGTPFYATHIEAGMTPEQFEKYVKLGVDLATRTNQEVQRQVAEAQQRALKAWGSEEFTKMEEKATAEWDEQKSVQALLYLEKGQRKLEDGRVRGNKKTGKLNRKMVHAILGKDHPFVKRLEKGKRLVSKGEDPILVADSFGYEGNLPEKAMLEEAAALPDRAEAIEARTKEMMRDTYPNIDGELANLDDYIQRVLHGERTDAYLLKEFSRLTTNVRKGQVTNLARNAVLAAQESAKVVVSRRQVGRLEVGQTRRREESLAHQAILAVAKGNIELAKRLMLRRIMEHYTWKELDLARKDREKFEKHEVRWSDRKTRERIAKGNVEFLHAGDQIREALGLREIPVNPPARTGVEAVLRGLEISDGGSPVPVEDIMALLRNPPEGGWKKGTVDQMRQVHAVLKKLYVISRERRAPIVNGVRVEHETLVDKIEDEGQERHYRGPPPKDKEKKKIRHRIEARLSTIIGAQEILRLLPTLYDTLWTDGYMRGEKIEDLLAEEVLGEIQKIMKKLPKALRKVQGDKIYDTYGVEMPQDLRDPPVLTHEAMWQIALSMGSISNRKRTVGGYGWDEGRVIAWLDRNMSEAEWDLVESLWALSDKKLWPHVSKTYEEGNGLPPEKIQAKSFTLSSGRIISGGYHPAQYDRVNSRVGARQQAVAETGLVASSLFSIALNVSHTKPRVKNFSDVLRLDMGGYPSHIADVIHHVAFDRFIRQSRWLLGDPRVQATIEERIGPTFYLQLTDPQAGWLAGVAHPETFARNMQPLAEDFAWGRKRLMVQALAMNVPVAANAIMEPFEITHVKGGISKWNMARYQAQIFSPYRGFLWMRKRALTLGHEPMRRKKQVRRMLERELRAMGLSTRLSKDEGFRESVIRASFMAFELFDRYSVGIVWNAAFQDALDDKKTEKQAIAHADDVIVSNMPAYDVGRLSAVMKGPFAILMMIFHGYFNKRAQGIFRTMDPVLQDWHAAEGAGEKAMAGTRIAMAVASLMMMMMASQAGGELIGGHGPEPDEEWGEWMMRKMMAAPFQFAPFVGGPAQVVAGGISSKLFQGEAKFRPFSTRSTPLFAVGERLGRAGKGVMDGDREADQRFWDAMEIVGLGSGYPIGSVPVSRAGRFVTSGEFGEASVVGKVEGILHGGGREAKEATLLTVLKD